MNRHERRKAATLQKYARRARIRRETASMRAFNRGAWLVGLSQAIGGMVCRGTT
jgi:hypothetical protein